MSVCGCTESFSLFNCLTVVSWKCPLDAFISCRLHSSATLPKQEKSSPTWRSPQPTCRIEKRENYSAFFFFFPCPLHFMNTLRSSHFATYSSFISFKLLHLHFDAYTRNMETCVCRELETSSFSIPHTQFQKNLRGLEYNLR